MDEKTAWDVFRRTGTVRDYLTYTQCKAKSQQAQSKREDQNEDRRPGPGGFGETRG